MRTNIRHISRSAVNTRIVDLPVSPAPEATWCSPDLAQGVHAHLVESADAKSK